MIGPNPRVRKRVHQLSVGRHHAQRPPRQRLRWDENGLTGKLDETKHLIYENPDH
jgi:hypothetical protein